MIQKHVVFVVQDLGVLGFCFQGLGFRTGVSLHNNPETPPCRVIW